MDVRHAEVLHSTYRYPSSFPLADDGWLFLLGPLDGNFTFKQSTMSVMLKFCIQNIDIRLLSAWRVTDGFSCWVIIYVRTKLG